MPIDTQKLLESKENIISKIKVRGPSLPVQVAREANISLLFASAYLSELYNERKVKMSNMKVGSTPLYYLEGQENLLENFVQYLNNKEREAHTLLKLQKLLNDEKIEPAIRVAMRAIKDFAVPVRIKVGEESKLFWKHYLASDEETTELARSMLGLKKEKKKEEDKQEKIEEDKKVEDKQEKIEEDKKVEDKITKVPTNEQRNQQLKELRQKIDDISNELKSPQVNSVEKKKKSIPESKFVRMVKEHLTSKNIEILEILDEKKKDFLAKVRTDSPFGKQEYLLTAKEKKKITDEDLTIAIHKAQLEKMPALFLAPGEIDKKSLDHANTWKNLVKFSKL